jgi:hypothetical protein
MGLQVFNHALFKLHRKKERDRGCPGQLACNSTNFTGLEVNDYINLQ